MLTGVSWSSPDHTQGTDCIWHVYVFTVVVVVWEGGGRTPSAPMFSPHQIWSGHTRIVCGSVYVWFPHLINSSSQPSLKLTQGMDSERKIEKTQMF